MINGLIIKLFTVVLGLLKPETLKRVVDKGLDVIENAVEDTPNKIDDSIVLPLCEKIREAFDIPDND